MVVEAIFEWHHADGLLCAVYDDQGQFDHALFADPEYTFTNREAAERCRREKVKTREQKKVNHDIVKLFGQGAVRVRTGKISPIVAELALNELHADNLEFVRQTIDADFDLAESLGFLVKQTQEYYGTDAAAAAAAAGCFVYRMCKRPSDETPPTDTPVIPLIDYELAKQAYAEFSEDTFSFVFRTGKDDPHFRDYLAVMAGTEVDCEVCAASILAACHVYRMIELQLEKEREQTDAVKHLEPHEYREYLEYRVSDADGWQMYLDEEDDEE
ncbi:unnamed protein product [Durusdinium trenchii]|uniref:Uncharacterized protein n=1 Tax=Durusdinium trenchii TaxID=1381693 RepID=A0ABP0PSJ6_9DINO